MSRAARTAKSREKLERMTLDELNAEIKYLELRSAVVRTGAVGRAFKKEIALAKRARKHRFDK